MISKNDHGKLNPDNLEDSLHQQRQPKYIFIGFFTHGAYHEVSTKPYRENEHASKSIKTFRSTPKLMTFTNSSPGNIVLGEADGSDNTKLTNYFKRNSDINFMTDSAKDQEKIIAESFLNYSKNGLATLATNPRDDLERAKNTKTIAEKYVRRNSFICTNKVGIGHTFPNKSFSTVDPSADAANMDSWGIFIFNNNCGIEPGTRIEELLPEMKREIITEDDEEIGVRFHLDDIISAFENKYRLTSEDYLFLFDYTCSIFSGRLNSRTVRSWGRQVAKDFGFGKKRTNKRSKKRTRKLKKKNGLY
jgi:hypothetical protein